MFASYALLVTTIIINIALKITGQATFELNLEKFINDDGLNQTGKCCAQSLKDDDTCSSPCRTAFRVCLDHFQAHVVAEPTCTFGRFETSVLGRNTFFPADSPSFHNPIRFELNFRWPGSFTLIVDVIHTTANTSLQSSVTDWSEVAISRLIKSATLLPATNSNKGWSRPPPYRHMKTELHYSYRVVCQENLYGPSCSTYCRPRHDIFGHYKCNELGEKTCLPGWKGNSDKEYCNTALCLDGCHPSQGTCKMPNKCECKHGWTGTLCNECAVLPGCEHGTCSTPFECNCNLGWGGPFCNQDLNYCINHQPCENGASCVNAGQGSYRCHCAPGFAGDDCKVELNECESNPCKNGAECVDLINDYQCKCNPGFFGPNCDKTEITCDNSPCKNDGICTEGGKHYKCTCRGEFFGVNCENIKLNPDPCAHNPCNKGTCVSTSTGYSCQCPINFRGRNCEKPGIICSGPLSCLNGGTCRDATFEGNTCSCSHCDCPYGFTGRRCHRLSNKVSTEPSSKSSYASFLSKNLSSSNYKHDNSGLANTKVVTVNDAELSTTQWIGICFGSGVIVLLLVISSACLVYHRKKVILSKLLSKSKETSSNHSISELEVTVTLTQPSRELEDLPFNGTTAKLEDIRETKQIRTYGHASNGHALKNCELETRWKPYVLAGTARNDLTPLKAPVDNLRDKDRLDGECFSQAKSRKYMKDVTHVDSLKKKQKRGYHTYSPVGVSEPVVSRPNSTYSEPSQKSSIYPMSRLPTYEEVCDENRALIKIGHQQEPKSDVL